MTTKADFTQEEWHQLTQAPVVAGLLVIGADLSMIGFVDEAKAMTKAMQEAAPDASDQELINELTDDAKKRVEAHEKMETVDFKNEDDFAAGLKQISDAVPVVESKASPEEAQAYKQWVMAVAQATAGAAKEGGLFGKKVLVSDKEKAMLERIQQALGM